MYPSFPTREAHFKELDPIKLKWSLGYANVDFIEEEKKRRKKKGKVPLPDIKAKRPNFVDDEILFHSNLDPAKKKRIPWPGPCNNSFQSIWDEIARVLRKQPIMLRRLSHFSSKAKKTKRLSSL